MVAFANTVQTAYTVSLTAQDLFRQFRGTDE